MRDRIKQIMDREGSTPSLFADKLSIGRAVISHILNGRNNPSLDVVTCILETYPHINSDWLLLGTGLMFREEADGGRHIQSNPALGLFEDTKEDIGSVKEGDNSKTGTTPIAIQPTTEPIKTIIKRELVNKEIAKIIIYYEDNTFQSFNPSESPL